MTARLYRAGGFVADEWTHLDDEAELPAEGAVIVPLARFLEQAADLPQGLRLAPLVKAGDDPASLAGHLAVLELVVVDFAKFSDGRGYSTARLLRQRYGFAGEVRASGDVLLDQIPLMRRVGFDAFAVVNEPTIRALEAGHDVDVPLYLQPAERAGEVPAGARYWARRPADAQLS